MKLLLDQGTPRSAAALLREAGHEGPANEIVIFPADIGGGAAVHAHLIRSKVSIVMPDTCPEFRAKEIERV